MKKGSTLEAVKNLLQEGVSPGEIARRLEISRQRYYQIKNDIDNPKPPKPPKTPKPPKEAPKPPNGLYHITIKAVVLNVFSMRESFTMREVWDYINEHRAKKTPYTRTSVTVAMRELEREGIVFCIKSKKGLSRTLWKVGEPPAQAADRRRELMAELGLKSITDKRNAVLDLAIKLLDKSTEDDRPEILALVRRATGAHMED